MVQFCEPTKRKRDGLVKLWVFIVVVAIAVFAYDVYVESEVANDVANGSEHNMPEDIANWYFYLCQIALANQIELLYYKKIASEHREVRGDIRGSLDTAVTNIEEHIANIVHSYNNSIQRFERSDAKHFDIPYELSTLKLNSCAYEP